MSNLELDCNWHFATVDKTAGDEGPNNAMSQTFSHFPSSALVRESIQNSLDAVLSESEPVKVCFEYRTLEKNDYKNFFSLSNHIDACKKYYNGYKIANTIYSKMLDCLNNSKDIGYIRVSDYNTKGMDYETDKRDKTFYAFVRSAGVSIKQAEGAGGSFGFGKGAFFVMSPINTLIVSTCTPDFVHHFEGVTRLCTHEIDGKKCDYMGFYDNNNGEPTRRIDMIPKSFRRVSRLTNNNTYVDKPGTSISIMGIEYNEWNKSKSMFVEEVLANFFVAILRNKLVVIINGNDENDQGAITINSSTIGHLMKSYYPSIEDNKERKFNPRPYFEAMIAPDNQFNEVLPILGRVTLYLKEFNDTTRIIYLRKLLMKVYRKRRSLGQYNGVFICENEDGNKILRDMEDPEHKSWDREQCQKDDITTDYTIASKAEIEIESFVNKCIDNLLNVNTSDSVQVSQLEKYLYSYENEKGKGEKENPFIGRPTGNYVKDGASMTTEGAISPELPKNKKIRKGQTAEIEIGIFKKEDNGTILGGIGNNHNGRGGNRPGAGDNFTFGVVKDGEGSYKHIVEVDWRPIQSVKKGFTDIVIYSPKDIESAELCLKIGREIQSSKTVKEDVYIISSNKGKCNGLKIKNVYLKANVKNIIQISFSDNMLHTLILEVYEVN